MLDWRDLGPHSDAEPDNPCDDCHECGLRCVAGIQMTRPEFDRIVNHLRGEDPHQVIRVFEQDKWMVWFEEVETEACLFYDVAKRRCLVYPARPLVCRLFGRVEWMPCPIGKQLPPIADGLRLFQAYAGHPRATFGEWCMQIGLFDFREIISGSR